MLSMLLRLLVCMHHHVTKYLVCYDICEPKRLRRVHRLIRDWGVPIQFSLFEVELTLEQLKQLQGDLMGFINQAEDKVMFYRLSPQQTRICLGVSVQTQDLLFV